MVGKHGSPVQFFFTPNSNLIAMMESTCEEKISQNGCVRTENSVANIQVDGFKAGACARGENYFSKHNAWQNNISTSLVFS